jgi:hypothetical protein
LLTIAFACVLVKKWRAGRRPQLAELGVALPVLALGAYATHLWIGLGTPLAAWMAHTSGWHVRPKWNLLLDWRDAYFTLLSRKHIHMQIFDALQLALPVPLLALSIQAWRTLGTGPGVYATLCSVLIVFLGHESLGREALAVVPAFGALGAMRIGRALSLIIQACLFTLLCLFTYAFVTGDFLG